MFLWGCHDDDDDDEDEDYGDDRCARWCVIDAHAWSWLITVPVNSKKQSHWA